MVKVSVIVPVFNVEKYLDQCLESIVNQTLEDIEIICIDDGSADSSLDILKDYEKRDLRVKVLSQKNMGVSNARNRGLEIADGKYIYFADSDDYLEIDALKKLYELSINKNLDLLIFKLVNFDGTGNTDYTYSDMPFLPKDIFSYHDFKSDVFKVDVTVYTKFFKRDLVCDKRFAEGLIFEDNAFYIDYIFDARRIHFLDECLYNRRLRDDSIISKASKNYCDLFRIHEIIIEKLKSRGLYDEFREMYFMRKVDSLYYRLRLIEQKYRDDYFFIMKEDFLNQKDEYENVMDLDKINDYHKSIFKSVISSQNVNEIELYMKMDKLKNTAENLKNENRQLEEENKRLDELNQSLISSKSWKITEPLRKFKGR